MPLVTAGQRPVFVDATQAFATVTSPDFNPRETICLPPEARASLSSTSATPARIDMRAFQAHRIEFEVNAEASTVAVIAQAWYPAWLARVDGQPVPLWRANHAFQALPVPAGRHQVQLVYRDRKFLAGAVVSGITLAICLAGLRVSRRRA